MNQNKAEIRRSMSANIIDFELVGRREQCHGNESLLAYPVVTCALPSWGVNEYTV